MKMYEPWQEARVLIVVKTYPTPSAKHTEVSCTAGIRENGSFIRLFPVPFRFLNADKRFAKYTWVRVPIKKASDSRPESYNPDVEQVTLEEFIDTKRNWAKRQSIIQPLVSRSIEELKDRQAADGTSLGIVRPKTIKGFYMKPANPPTWTPKEEAKLRQPSLFNQAPAWILQKLPFEFHYEFDCDDPRCTGHDMCCFDWEIGEAYRSWKVRYPDPVEFDEKFHNRFRDEVINKFDTHFFVGTLAGHPKNWTIIGLYRPQKE